MSHDPLHLPELAVITEEVTSGVRHDVRNKLGSVRNAAFYIRRRLSPTDAWAGDPRIAEMSRLLDADVGAASALLGSVDEKLYGRRCGAIDMSQVVGLALEHARARPASVDREVGTSNAWGDLKELAVAVRALLENAAESAERGAVRVLGRAEGSLYRLEIFDEGSGIPPRALEPFFTTKPGRAGLGLNVARRIAQRHKGALELGAGTGRGSVATLSLPLEEPKDGDNPRR